MREWRLFFNVDIHSLVHCVSIVCTIWLLLGRFSRVPQLLSPILSQMIWVGKARIIFCFVRVKLYAYYRQAKWLINLSARVEVPSENISEILGAGYTFHSRICEVRMEILALLSSVLFDRFWDAFSLNRGPGLRLFRHFLSRSSTINILMLIVHFLYVEFA